jgi:hypothetical protein
MNQHKQLHPSYGPEPWGARLKGLDTAIPAASDGANAPERSTDLDDVPPSEDISP